MMIKAFWNCCNQP